ncbi:MAG: butyrate kinase [bacterium]|nr:butyrate kinase [bacterium]
MYDIEQALDKHIVEFAGIRPTVIFTEPTDIRIIESLCHLVRFVRPILLASEASVRAIAAKELPDIDHNALEFALSECTFIQIHERPELIDEFTEKYRSYCSESGQEISEEEARELVSQQGLFGIMAVKCGHADMVAGGAYHNPRLYYRPMVKLLCPTGFCAEAGIFVLPDTHPKGIYPGNIVVFGDVGVNYTINSDTLARIALGTSMIARDIIPDDIAKDIRVALVSYSHDGTDEDGEPAVIREAAAKVLPLLAERASQNEHYKSIKVSGAVKASVALSARSAVYHQQDGSKWEGSPSVIVCPNLEMGNMLYHLYATSYPEAKHFTMMFGLRNQGISLARDCSPEDIRLAVKSTVLRMHASGKIPVKSETFFKQPLILAINPGSTSTKISVYRGENEIFADELAHTVEDLAQFEGKRYIDQFQYRKDMIEASLAKAGIKISDLDAISARGGLLGPMPHGTYYIGDVMLDELNHVKWGDHACNLGAMIADSLIKNTSIPAYIVDPGVVDELEERVRITGIKELRRRPVSHALNQFAIARRYAEEHETFYERLNLIVCHMGGGISVGAHRHGAYVDVNNALEGEGPFSPERSGSLPVGPLIDMCFSGKYTYTDMRRLNRGKGGMVSLLGTADLRKVEQMCEEGDERAQQVMEAQAYSIAKEITSLWPAFNGQEVDQILLTGGMARCKPLVERIKQLVSGTKVGVSVYPGENEMLALVKGALRVLSGKEKPKVYPPEK